VENFFQSQAMEVSAALGSSTLPELDSTVEHIVDLRIQYAMYARPLLPISQLSNNKLLPVMSMVHRKLS
jgi:hypothetical protein